MQLFPHIHAVLGPLDPLVVTQSQTADKHPSWTAQNTDTVYKSHWTVGLKWAIVAEDAQALSEPPPISVIFPETNTEQTEIDWTAAQALVAK